MQLKGKTAAAQGLLLLASTFLLGACGSGGLGGILGGGSQNDTTSASSGQISGTVERVDERKRAVVLEVSDYSSRLRGSTSGLVEVYYDEQTVVEHEGRGYPPTALERGDRVTAMVRDVDGRPYANRIRVDYDSTPYDQQTGSRDDPARRSNWDEMVGRGTVRWIDTRNRTVEIENIDWASRSQTTDRMILDYDEQTRVLVNGRIAELRSLDRGDYVEFSATDERRPYVRQIEVLRDTGIGSYGADLRGTVRFVDTRDRYVEIERGSERWSSNFRTGTSVSGDVARIYYDDRTVVEYQGQNYTPANLERGDVVDVWTETVSGRLYSPRMVVVQNVRSTY